MQEITYWSMQKITTYHNISMFGIYIFHVGKVFLERQLQDNGTSC